jgi:hypothetical protein
MPWRLSGVEFYYNDQPVVLHADGNIAARVCPCGGPVLFIFQAGRIGSHPTRRSMCPLCKTTYHLTPPHNFMPEPAMSIMPAGRMTIIGSAPIVQETSGSEEKS